MRLYLHIGTGKTATTTIQSFLNMNRAALGKQSVFFPESLGKTNNRKLPAMVVDDDFVDDFFKVNHLLNEQDRRVAKARWRESFIKELERNQAQDTAIISSEHLSTLLKEERHLQTLHAILSDHFDDIKILVYLRRPVDFAVSMYNTAIKIGGTQRAPVPAHENSDTDYASLIQRWASVFGQQNLIVRLFDRESLIGGDILQDFCAVTGIDDQCLHTPERHNPSLDHLGLELLRHMNTRIPRFVNNRPNPGRPALVATFEKHFSCGPAYVPPPRVFRDYEKAFRRSNAWVCKTFFPKRRRLFSKKPPPETPPLDISDADLNRMADLITDLWQHRTEMPQKRRAKH